MPKVNQELLHNKVHMQVKRMDSQCQKYCVCYYAWVNWDKPKEKFEIPILFYRG